MIATLVNELQASGKYEVNFDVAQISNLPGNKTGLCNGLPSGIYFYTLRVGDSSPDKSGSEFVETRKMLMMK